ncbi:MAG: hypothetical protein JO257_20050 [Deltaproteobacteria bacterium]|nr:hypothetical protein [Deltaproteobacteria bacterium]
MRAVAVALIVSMLAGCFPHDAHRRTIAQLIEGGTLGVGIGMEYFANTSADCDQMMQTGGPSVKCDSTRQAIGSVGVVLILAGLVGFISTISTAEDDSDNGSGSATAH